METKGKMPIIGDYIRNIGTLVAIEEIKPEPPPEPILDYIFEEITARNELQLNGETLKVLTSLCDFYGLGTSVETAIKEAQISASRRHLGPKTDLEVVTIKTITKYRARPNGKIEFWDSKYLDFSILEGYHGIKDLPEPIETVVWSSKNESTK